jgi:predicted nucleic acid-binding protein
MVRQRIYIDTSVLGGCLDEEFRECSRSLIDRFSQGKAIAVISELTLLELKDTPEPVQKILKELPEESIQYVELTKDASDLARRYIAEGVLGEERLVDAQHIAIATVERVDVLVSWNFKHIVNNSAYPWL